MIISIRSQASSEERAQLLALLGRVKQHQQPITPTSIDGREVITLDGSHVDAQASALLRQQGAVERVMHVKTPYKLVNRSFKPQGSSFLLGSLSSGKAVTIGPDAHGVTSPVIIAGPCAVENREQLLTTARAVKAAGAQVLRGGALNRVPPPTSSRDLVSKGCSYWRKPGK